MSLACDDQLRVRGDLNHDVLVSQLRSRSWICPKSQASVVRIPRTSGDMMQGTSTYQYCRKLESAQAWTYTCPLPSSMEFVFCALIETTTT